jgi:hypothetical protein
MRCGLCGRGLVRAAGWLGNLPIGPICLARLKPRKSKGKRRKVQAERQTENQLNLFE